MGTVEPAAAEVHEFLINGSFETVGAATPSGWSFTGGFGKGYAVETGAPYAGENALKIKADGTALYAHQSIEGLCGGEDYTLTAAIRAESYGSASLQIKFEFYSLTMYGKRVSVGETVLRPAPQKNNKWEFFTYTVEAPEGAFSANVLFRLPSTSGTVYYDALSLTGPRTEDAAPAIRAEDLPVYENLPMHAEGQELITNGDMEAKTETGLAGWSFNASRVTMVDSPVKSGSTALKLVTETETDAFATYTVSGLRSNAEYQVSVFMRSPVLLGNGFGMKYEFLGTDHYSEGLSEWIRCITGTNWMRFAVTFRCPEGADRARILFRLFGTGTVYIDDASCYMTEEAYAYDMETDAAFYYADVDAASVSLTVNPDKAEALSGETVTCILSGEGVSLTRTATVTPAGTAVLSLPLTGLAKETPYTVTTTLQGVTKTETIYVYDRPSALRADGIYRLADGTVFDPIFAYHIGTADYAKAKAAGFNLVQGTPSDSLLSAAAENDVMVLAVLYNDMLPAGHPANAEATKKTVEKYKNNASIFAWCIMDEPYANNPGASKDLAESYRIIRSIDKVHPVFVMQDGDNYREAAKYTDILGIDPYPAGKHDPLGFVYERTRKAVEAGKPVYCLQQAFTYGNWFPTADEIENMNVQALLAGAKGIGYYEWNSAKNGVPLYETEIWDGIVSFHLEKTPILFRGIVHSSHTPGETDSVRYSLFAADGKQYLLLQNGTASVQTVQLSLPGENMLVETSRVDIEAAVSGRTLTVTLPPSAAALCEVLLRGDTISLCIGDRVIRSPMPGDSVRAAFPVGAGTGYLAAYSGAELVKLVYAGETMTVDKNIDCIKAFYWRALQPECESVSWNVRDDADIIS